MNLTGVAAFVVLLVLLSGLRIAREYQRAVVFRLGRYTGLRGPGLFWLIPLGVENETRVDLRIVTKPIEQERPGRWRGTSWNGTHPSSAAASGQFGREFLNKPSPATA